MAAAALSAKAEGASLLLPIMAVVFVAFLVIGIAMPILPLHVHDGLGQSTFVVGLGAGLFAASLISRPMAGHYFDTRTAKRGVIVGLLAAKPIPPSRPRHRQSRARIDATAAMLDVVFLASAATVLCAAVVAWWLMAHPATAEDPQQ
jgi:MFS family permease